MLYKDFIEAGITIEKLEAMKELIELSGYELEEYLETLAIVDSNGIYKAIGLDAIVCFIKQINITAICSKECLLTDLYSKVVA